MPQRPGVLTLPMVPITDYAARVLTARAAASNTPHRPDGRAPAYLLPSLLPASPATPRCAHALAAVDDHGRTRPGSLLTALGWTASTRLACRAAGSALVLTADPQGQSLLDPQGRLRLPLAARQVLNLNAGSRALLSVSPGTLTVQPATILDTLAEALSA